jgi:hypothetical protein
MNISITIAGSTDEYNYLVVLGNSFNRCATILDADHIRSMRIALYIPFDTGKFIRSVPNIFWLNTFDCEDLLGFYPVKQQISLNNTKNYHFYPHGTNRRPHCYYCSP